MNILYIPFSYLMKGCLYIAGNSYLLALLFFALAMEIILIPLAIKQQRSQVMAAKIRPKEMAIREKYKGRTDRATQMKMTNEIQEMYQKEGHNQFAGCLPLLIQLPIIFILFAIVRNPITYASSIEGFDKVSNAEAAIEFYQTEKEMISKDAEDYNDIIETIETYQKNLGGVVKQGEDKKDVVENGVTVYTPSGKDTSLVEMELSRLMIDGRDNLQELIDENIIDASILTVYDETGFESYKDKLPNYRVAGVNLIDEPDLNGDVWLLLIPLLVFLTSFLSTKLTRKLAGASQQTDANGNPIGGGLFMEVGMPLISAMFTFSFSGAVGVYWIWRTVVSSVKSVIMAKAMPIPNVTEEDIAAARKELKANVKKKKVITIEVDEDDDSYDSMMVRDNGQGKKTVTVDPTQRTPRRVEMLTADDEDDTSNG